MPSKKTKISKKNKRYHLEFSVTSAFFWSLGLFFLLGWIFVLGILVGRGSFPGGVKTLHEMKTQIARLQDMISRKDTSDLDPIGKLAKDPKFRFYDELGAKKEQVAKKSTQGIKENSDKADLDRRIKALEETVAKRIQQGIKKTGVRTMPDKKVEPSQSGRIYTVQLASLGSEIEATKMVNRLNDRGYPAYFCKAHINGKIYYRVRCGAFRTKEESQKFKGLLAQKEGLTGFIARRLSENGFVARASENFEGKATRPKRP